MHIFLLIFFRETSKFCNYNILSYCVLVLFCCVFQYVLWLQNCLNSLLLFEFNYLNSLLVVECKKYFLIQPNKTYQFTNPDLLTVLLVSKWLKLTLWPRWNNAEIMSYYRRNNIGTTLHNYENAVTSTLNMLLQCYFNVTQWRCINICNVENPTSDFISFWSSD